MPGILEPRRICVITVAAVASQIALSVPRAELSALETISEDTCRLQRTYQPTWLTLGVYSWKTVIWCSSAFELASHTVQGLQASLLNLRPSARSYSAVLGICMLVVGAAAQVASRRALGRIARFPVLPWRSPPQRLLYIPATQLPAKPTAPRPQHVLDDERGLYTVRPTHVLVTSGPYGHVRHPMFAAFQCGLLGSACFYLASYSPLHSLFTGLRVLISHLPRLYNSSTVRRGLACGDTLPWRYLTSVAFCLFALRTAMHLRKMSQLEDDALGTCFGPQWKVYRWSVRSMYFPGLL